jgi:transposase
LDCNLLFRAEHGRCGLEATVFTTNRERLLAGDVAQAFFARVLAQAREQGFLADEHFTVDGTLIEAWSSLKSVMRAGRRRLLWIDIDVGRPCSRD